MSTTQPNTRRMPLSHRIAAALAVLGTAAALTVGAASLADDFSSEAIPCTSGCDINDAINDAGQLEGNGGGGPITFPGNADLVTGNY